MKDSLGNTDTMFNGVHDVTISGHTAAPDGTYGSLNGAALTAGSNTIRVTFTNGVATLKLGLNQASAQAIAIKVADVIMPAANTLSIAPKAGSAVSMALTTDVAAPVSNGSVFAQQPVVTLLDAHGNTSTGDNSTVVTVSKQDAGVWTLTGTVTATASLGVVAFTDLGTTNSAEVTGAQLVFEATGMTPIMSQTVTLPWPSAAAPTIESVTAGDGHVRLTWSEVYGAVSHDIYLRTADEAYGQVIASVTGSMYDAIGLTNGTTYYFVIKAVNPGGESAASNEVSATPQVPAPGVPVLGSPAPGDSQVSLTWDPVDGSTGYKIYKSTSSGAYGLEEASVTDSVYSYNLTGLSNGTPYYFVVKSSNPGGDSAASNEVSATPRTVPSAPTDVIAAAGNGQATVSFTAPANGGSAITYYEVTAMPGNITVRGAGSPLTVRGLSNGVTYTFTVRAVNSAGSSMASDDSNSVTPSAPTGSGDTPTPPQPSSPPAAVPGTTPSAPSSSSAATPDTAPDLSRPADSVQPAVEIFHTAIISEANLLKLIEAKVAEAKSTNVNNDFTDISGHWAEKSMRTMAKLRLIEGYQNGTLKPDGNITRAEFAMLLIRICDLQKSSGSSIELKVIDNHWAEDAIVSFVAAGVISGYKDGTFRPDNSITREEMVVMLSRILNLNNMAKDTTKGNFTDLEGSYAASEIRAGAQAGIISGKGNEKFDPKSSATRAEALQIILNVLRLKSTIKDAAGFAQLIYRFSKSIQFIDGCPHRHPSFRSIDVTVSRIISCAGMRSFFFRACVQYEIQ